MPDKPQFDKPAANEIKDLPPTEKNLAGKEADNVKGGRMRSEPEVTKNDTTNMYA
ncbi:MAG: hypothetical protein ABIY52_02355 [Gemmatimonadaceae bacterium]